MVSPCREASDATCFDLVSGRRTFEQIALHRAYHKTEKCKRLDTKNWIISCDAVPKGVKRIQWSNSPTGLSRASPVRR